MSSTQTFHVRAPCRIDLSGGTVDLWPIYLFYPEGLSLNNMALELYAHAEVSFAPADKFQLTIESRDMKVKRKHASLVALEKSIGKSVKANSLRWVERVAAHFFRSWGLESGHWTLTTWSEVPPGSGLGGSSTLGIAIGAAIAKASGHSDEIRKDPWKYQQTMRDLESIEIEHPAGDQDYVPAIFGGLLTFGLGVHRREINKHEASRADDVSSRLALIYTGKPHHSGINNWQVYKDFIGKKASVTKALGDIQKISRKMSEDLRAGRTKAWIKGVGEEWSSRQRLGKAVNAPVLQKAAKWAKSLGAVSVKACGAGGGGCLLVVFPDASRRDKALSIDPISKDWRWMKVSCSQEGILDAL
jgi:D-glycero-alpha-D-manno-heptose-7-phosphate kinase